MARRPVAVGRRSGVRVASVIAALGIATACGANACGQSPLWTYTTRCADADRMGDFDGDGVADVLVDDQNAFAVAILSGVDGHVLASFALGGVPAGYQVAGVGDQNGDGVRDFLATDLYFVDSRGSSVGRVVGISGADGATFFSYQGADHGLGGHEASAGIGPCSVGDGTGDGKEDFAFGVGATPGPFGFGPSTVTQMSNGAGSGYTITLPFRFDSTSLHPIAPIGDVDGDGASDFATNDFDVGTLLGTVEVRAGATGTLLRTLVGNTSSDHFGAALGSCGDLDGDGVRESIVGAWGSAENGANAGRVDVFSGATGTRLWQLLGEVADLRFGTSVDGLNDIDGDGLPDLAIACAGGNGVTARVDIVSGGSGFLLQRITPVGAGRVRDVGDLDGDGRDDVAVMGFTAVEAFAVRPDLALDAVAPDRIRYDRVGTLALHGAGFLADPGLVVTFDGVAATNVQILGFNDLTCTPPPLLPGPHDVTIQSRFGSVTHLGGLLLTPALAITGSPVPGGAIDLAYEFDPFDSTFAIVGLPPPVALPVPHYGGVLGILPFFPLFTLSAWPSDEFVVHADIPNDPALSGFTLLLQALTGPQLFGHPVDAAWTNLATLAIQ